MAARRQYARQASATFSLALVPELVYEAYEPR